MCYFLYGGVNDEINKNDFQKIKSKTFKFNLASHNILLKAFIALGKEKAKNIQG